MGVMLTNHVMIDLETMAKTPDAAIVSIGAVKFWPSAQKPLSRAIGERFSANVRLESSIYHGLKMDPSTVMWWLGRPEEARSALTRYLVELDDALHDFEIFLGKNQDLNQDFDIWARGSSFDLPILANAFQACHRVVPWNHRQIRDTRTLEWTYSLLGGPEIPELERPDAHQALPDALYEVERVIRMVSWLEDVLKPIQS